MKSNKLFLLILVALLIFPTSSAEASLFGSSQVRAEGIAEAMMYTRDKSFAGNRMKPDGTPWFEPISTNEGDISNVSLIYNNLESGVITHEIMHLYGLTDLYGSQYSPPFSLMSDMTLNLLPYEKWVLGWLPDSSVTCVDKKTEIFNDSNNNKFVVNYSSGPHSLVIPTGATSALVIDIFKLQSGEIRLLFYSLNNEDRPAIGVFQKSVLSKDVVMLNARGGVGKLLTSPEYNLLVSDNDGSDVTIHLIQASQVNSEATVILMKLADSKRLEISEFMNNMELLKRAEAEKQAAAELKAIEDASAKAAADLLIQQKAVASANALKKKTITCLKGKLTKKITAVKPACPTGYKKKV